MYDRKRFLKSTYATDDSDPDLDLVSDELPVINVRKCLLIVDDIESNREILGDLLREDYDVLYANDGVEALEMLRSHIGEIDLDAIVCDVNRLHSINKRYGRQFGDRILHRLGVSVKKTRAANRRNRLQARRRRIPAV